MGLDKDINCRDSICFQLYLVFVSVKFSLKFLVDTALITTFEKSIH